MPKIDLSNQLAADMGEALQSREFENLFKKASVLVKKTAAKKCECKGCDKENCECDDNCTPAAKADDANKMVTTEHKTTTVSEACKLAVDALSKVSEVLDEAGLEKTASLSLSLINAIVVEAKKKSKMDDDKAGKDDKKKDLKKKDEKGDKNDARKAPKSDKDPKKELKKDDKKEDKKEFPFKKK